MTKKQQTFINQYYKHRNATRAAKESGYSEHTATQIAYDLLRKPKIKAKLQEMLKAVGQEL
jgi:phage terminase small subunit